MQCDEVLHWSEAVGEVSQYLACLQFAMSASTYVGLEDRARQTGGRELQKCQVLLLQRPITSKPFHADYGCVSQPFVCLRQRFGLRWLT